MWNGPGSLSMEIFWSPIYWLQGLLIATAHQSAPEPPAEPRKDNIVRTKYSSKSLSSWPLLRRSCGEENPDTSFFTTTFLRQISGQSSSSNNICNDIVTWVATVNKFQCRKAEAGWKCYPASKHYNWSWATKFLLITGIGRIEPQLVTRGVSS